MSENILKKDTLKKEIETAKALEKANLHLKESISEESRKLKPVQDSQDFVKQLVQHDMLRTTTQPQKEKSLKKPSPATPNTRQKTSLKLESEINSNDKKFPGIFSSVLRGLVSQDMAMDLGTANTLIYMRGKGIVLNEPSVVAVDHNTNKAVAVGKPAKDMYGKTSGSVKCIRPLKDGVIADFEITHLMIKDFVQRVSSKWQIKRPTLIVSVPSGITMVEKRAVIDAALASGARNVHLIEEPMAAAIGADLPVTEPTGSMIVDIGGGTTEVAVISMGATAYSESVRIAGDEMDEAIEHYLRRTFNVEIGIFEAERLKLAIGSAMPMNSKREMSIFGRDLTTGVPRELVVDDSVIRKALKEPVGAIVDAVIRALERTSPELAEDIIKNGIHIAGGGSLLAGLSQRLSLETGIKFTRTEKPLTAIVRGTGLVLETFKEMKKVCIT